MTARRLDFLEKLIALRSTRPVKARGLGCVILASVLLTACTSPPPSELGADRFIVESVVLDHEIRFAADATDRLSLAEIDRLRGFLVEADSNRDSSILIVGSNTEVGAHRRATVQELVQSTGRRLAGLGEKSLPPEHVTIRIERRLVLPKACMNADGWPTAGDLPARCANDLNLLAMVENEDDLLQGRTLGLAPAAPAGDLVRNYRDRFKLPQPPSSEDSSLSPSPSAATLNF